MKVSSSSRKYLWVAILTVLPAFILPATASAQGRGYGRGRGDGFGKCGKFVNCHDARDGRWDGRGRRRNILRDRVFFSRPRIQERRRYYSMSSDRYRYPGLGYQRYVNRRGVHLQQHDNRYYGRRLSLRHNGRWHSRW